MTRSAIYDGDVFHTRLRPKQHSLHYRVFSLLLDLDELPKVTNRLFGYNRPAVLSFWDKDHGDGGPLRPWVERQLVKAGIDGSDRIEVLCYPRMFGYVFNPLTVYLCYGAGDRLAGILYEVHNTFGEARTYVIPVTGQGRAVTQRAPKELYVSPFMPMDLTYNFTIKPPADRVLIKIDEDDAQGLLLRATFSGRRKPFTDRALLNALLSHPLMTLKVTAAIHWEALRLWLKGVRLVHRDPAREKVAVSVVAHHAARHRELEPARQAGEEPDRRRHAPRERDLETL